MQLHLLSKRLHHTKYAHTYTYSYIGTDPARRSGTNLWHSASQFPTPLQGRLHALMTQEGDALLPLTLLVEKTALDITSIGVILEEFMMKILKLDDLQSKPKDITPYHHISLAYNFEETNCRLTSFSYSHELQRWEHPKARDDKREKHWWHTRHRRWLQTQLEQV